MLDHQSPIVRRLILFWLPIVGVIVLFFYLSQYHYDAQKEAQYGLQRINFWRKQAGLSELTHQAALQQAAQKHAQYLAQNADGHAEHQRSNPHFTGATPQERATIAGYHASVVENLTISNIARSGRRSADGLMTALYHRLSLLNPELDEVGAAWVRGKNSAFVTVAGSSQNRQLCESTPSQQPKRYILTLLCHGQKTEIPLDHPIKTNQMIVQFPIGAGVEPTYDGTEQPNPMPKYGKTGNPISIAFYGYDVKNPVQMVSFHVFQGNTPLQHTKILTAENDPNQLLDKTEFALFPLKPLEFDTAYRVEFVYRHNHQQKTVTWHFHTRKKRNIFEF